MYKNLEESQREKDSGFINKFQGFYEKNFQKVQELNDLLFKSKALLEETAKFFGEDDNSIK